MVTPIWLNGAGCAAAVPAVSVKANNKATNTFVFTDASLLSWISRCLRCVNAVRSHSNYHAPSVLKKGLTKNFPVRGRLGSGSQKGDVACSLFSETLPLIQDFARDDR